MILCEQCGKTIGGEHDQDNLWYGMCDKCLEKNRKATTEIELRAFETNL